MAMSLPSSSLVRDKGFNMIVEDAQSISLILQADIVYLIKEPDKVALLLQPVSSSSRFQP